MSRENEIKAFVRLLDVMDELREKCPWDRKQTMESLRPLTIEETYELSDSILEKDYKVYGLIRRYTNPNFSNTDYLGVTDKIEFVSVDMTDECSIINIIKKNPKKNIQYHQ